MALKALNPQQDFIIGNLNSPLIVIQITAVLVVRKFLVIYWYFESHITRLYTLKPRHRIS
jgi:hypothetical protein